ncbi:MAG TPA: hypothetical protein VFY12_09220 [Arenimonas sp.]|nr:hypothetical protein [Arenimonas sp.]
MNTFIEVNLALILFLPWFAILAALYWIYPRTPRNARRLAFDVASLVLAVLAAAIGTQWSYHNADLGSGAIWRQVLASTLSYAAFLLVLGIAFYLRQRIIIVPSRDVGTR